MKLLYLLLFITPSERLFVTLQPSLLIWLQSLNLQYFEHSKISSKPKIIFSFGYSINSMSLIPGESIILILLGNSNREDIEVV